MHARSFLTYRNLGILALILGALAQAHAEGTTQAALINGTNRNFRVKILTSVQGQIDPFAPYAQFKALLGPSANSSMEGRNLGTQALVLALGTGSATATVLGPNEAIEFKARTGFNILQTVDMTIQEEGSGAFGLCRYWAWESENDRGMLATGGVRTWDPFGSTSFSFEHPSGGRGARIVLGPAKPVETKGLAPEPGLLPEPEGHAERDVPPAVAMAIRQMDQVLLIGIPVAAPIPSAATPSPATPALPSSSTALPSQPSQPAPPGGL